MPKAIGNRSGLGICGSALLIIGANLAHGVIDRRGKFNR